MKVALKPARKCGDGSAFGEIAGDLCKKNAGILLKIEGVKNC